MKTITFGTLKGGVGKTAMCFHMAGILAELGYRVLLIDSDLQGNLTNNMGIERTGSETPTLYDVYHSQSIPEKVIQRDPNKYFPGVDLIPSSIFLHQAEMELSRIKQEPLLSLKKYFTANRNFFDRYDYTLIDTNPSMSLINQNAFAMSDSILLIADVSMNALEGAQLFIALWEESRQHIEISNNIHGLIINDFDSRTRLSADFLEYLDTENEVEDLKNLLLLPVIPRSVRFTEAELLTQPINCFDINAKGSIALTNLVEALFSNGIF